jgi:hypothetical protein
MVVTIQTKPVSREARRRGEKIAEKRDKKLSATFFSASPRLRVKRLSSPDGTQTALPSLNPWNHFGGMERKCTVGSLLWLIIIILVIMWLGGFAMHVGGGLIHLLLVIAVIIVIVQLVSGRRSI